MSKSPTPRFADLSSYSGHPGLDVELHEGKLEGAGDGREAKEGLDEGSDVGEPEGNGDMDSINEGIIVDG